MNRNTHTDYRKAFGTWWKRATLFPPGRVLINTKETNPKQEKGDERHEGV